MKRSLAITIASVFLLVGLACNISGSEKPTVPPPTAALNANARVAAGVAYTTLYSIPDQTGSSLGILMASAPLRIVKRTGDGAWLRVVTLEGLEGWVPAGQIESEVALELIAVEDSTTALTPPTTSPPEGEVLGASLAHLKEIFRRGQSLGNRANAFAKIGDSITVASGFLHPYGSQQYNLRQYNDLEEVISFFIQAAMYNDKNPFTASSQAAAVGWSTESVLNPEKADPRYCYPGEYPLLCEYLAVKPSIALIMLGTNDVSSMTAAAYEKNLHRIIDVSLERGVIPVISTIPVRQGYGEKVAQFNTVIKAAAETYDIPLWDYAAAMEVLPDQGISGDGTHPSLPPAGVNAAADFTPENLQYGFTIRNLTALQVLDALLRNVILVGR